VSGLTSASNLLLQTCSEARSPLPPIAKRIELSEKMNQQNCDKPSAKRKKEAIPLEEEGTVTKKPRAPRKKPAAGGTDKKALDKAHESHTTKSIYSPDPPVVKKRHTRKSQDEGQTKIKKARITKPGTTDNAAKAKKTAKGSKTKKTDETTEKGGVALAKGKEKVSAASDESLNLDEAVRRRRDWTPVKNTIPNLACLEDDEASPETVLASELHPRNDLLAVQLENLLVDFGYAQQGDVLVAGPSITRNTNGKGLIKRRKVELFDAVMPRPQPVKAKRSTSPKKKPQTITEKATAPFVTAVPQTPSSLLHYFPASVPEGVVDAATEDLAGVTSAKRRQRKSPVNKAAKPKAATKKAKKPISEVPVLLSPESAIKTAKDQELIFGTCSQLASEESPTFIRDLRKAMEASETMAAPITDSPTSTKSMGILLGSVVKSNVTSYIASRNLWSVASRDSGGSLLDADVVNLADSPKPQETNVIKAVLALPKSASIDVYTTPIDADVEWIIPRDLSEKVENCHKAVSTKEKEIIGVEEDVCESAVHVLLKGRPNSRSPVKKTKKAIVPPDHATSVQPRPDGMPNYQGFTTAELAKAVALYAFKAIKKREDMIALLERCWESKKRIALQALPSNVNIPQQLTAEAMVSELPQQDKSLKTKVKAKATKAGIFPVTADTNDPQGPSPKKPRDRPRKTSTDASSPKIRPATTSKKSKAPTKPQRLTTPLPVVDEISDSDSIPPTPSPPRRSSRPTPPLPLSPQKSTTTTLPHLSSPQDILTSITRAVTSEPPTHNPQNLTQNERILMYEPMVIEDLIRWLNEGRIGRLGWEWCGSGVRGGVCVGFGEEGGGGTKRAGSEEAGSKFQDDVWITEGGFFGSSGDGATGFGMCGL